MKRIVAFVIAVLGFCHLGFSQQDAKSKAILKKSEAHYKAFKSLTAEFTLTTNSEGKKPFTNKGTLHIKGNKFRLAYADQTIYCDGQNIWSYNPADEEVTLETYKKKTNDLSPQEMFNLYNKNFKSVYEGSSKAGKETHDIIKLVPKKRKEKYAYIKVFVDQKTSELRKIVQHFKNGNEVTVSITEFVANKNYSDSHFAWNAAEHKGAVLVDLR